MWTKNLPEEIIVEILLLLPVKSLVRFRCVSKRWRPLISDPRFTKSHFKRASEHTQRLLLSTHLRLGSLEIDAPFGDLSAGRELVFPFKQTGRCVRILGSCNGLVCVSLYDHKDFYIWNPSTGDHRKLPDHGIPSGTDTYRHGFGYDSSTDDYKPVTATCSDESCVYETQVLVFSLKSNAWEMIQDGDPDYPYYYLLCSLQVAGVLSIGALHWALSLSKPHHPQIIIALDLAEEEFREVPMPMDDDENEEAIYFEAWSNLEGFLWLACHGPTHMELWRMMEYGVQESWAPMFRTARFEYGYPRIPMFFSRGDQLVVLNGRKELIRYNPEGEILERFVVCSDPDGYEAAVFVESLLSLDGV